MPAVPTTTWPTPEAKSASAASIVRTPPPNSDRDLDLADELAHDLPVLRAAGARRVEVDEVQVARAVRHVGEGLLDRVAVDGLPGELAPHEPHRLAAADIDRRDAFHPGHPRLGSHSGDGAAARREGGEDGEPRFS